MDPYRDHTTGKINASSPTQQAIRHAVGTPKKVRMNLDEFRGGFDDALHLLGAFRRHAKAQGWTQRRSRR
ncbi:MAG: hypothetical protein IRY99_27665 [Isosphaeraceae bacterium]|nr:hypothetical protein [Isosphaeraceae bacterium]